MTEKAQDSTTRAAMEAQAASARRRPLGSDLKKIVPVWVVLVAGTLAVLWFMGTRGSGLLARLVYTSPSAWELAQVYRADGTNGWRQCLELVNERRGGQVRLPSAVGVLKGNPVLEKARKDLLRSIEFPGTFEDVPGMLADLSLWDGEVAESYAWRGDQATLMRQWPQALASYGIAESMGDKTAQVEEGRLESLIRLNRWDEATSLSKSLRSAKDLTSRFYRLTAEIYRKRGENQEEEAALRKAIEINSHDADSIIDLATLLVGQKRLKEAYKFFEEATRHNPNSGQLWHHRALLAQALNRPEEAIRCFKEGLKLQPNSFALHYDLAQLYLKLGRPREAQVHLTRAFELDPVFFARQKEKQTAPEEGTP